MRWWSAPNEVRANAAPMVGGVWGGDKGGGGDGGAVGGGGGFFLICRAKRGAPPPGADGDRIPAEPADGCSQLRVRGDDREQQPRRRLIDCWRGRRRRRRI